MPTSHLLYLGTYTRQGSKGIYATRLDGATGMLSPPWLVAETPDPAWITLSPDRQFLYAIHPSAAQATGFAVDPATGALAALPLAPAPPAQPPCHLVVDATRRALLVANYRDGYVAAISIRPDGTLGGPTVVSHEGRGPHPTRQDKAHVHSVTLSPDQRFLLVADLGLDRIYTYAVDIAAAKLTPATPPFISTAPGAGPRHFKFGHNGRHAYAINELDNTIVAYDYDAAHGALTPKQTVSTLPAAFTGANISAEIRLHPNGRFVYGSNRGHDSIAVFAIDTADGRLSSQPIEIVPTGGKSPRNFALSADGQWLVAAHQDTPLVTVFHVDPATGRLTRTPHTAEVPACVCVLFYE